MAANPGTNEKHACVRTTSCVRVEGLEGACRTLVLCGVRAVTVLGVLEDVGGHARRSVDLAAAPAVDVIGVGVGERARLLGATCAGDRECGGGHEKKSEAERHSSPGRESEGMRCVGWIGWRRA